MDYGLVVKAAWKSDPEFVTLCKTLYGENATPERVAKMSPDASAVHVPGNHRKGCKCKSCIPTMDNRGLEKRFHGDIPHQPRDYQRDDHGRFSSFAGSAADGATAGVAGAASLVTATKTGQNAKEIVGMLGRLRGTPNGRRAILRAALKTSGRTTALAAIGGVAGAAAAHHGKQAYEGIRSQTALEREHKKDVRAKTRELDFDEFIGEGQRNATVVTHGDRRDAVTRIVHKSGFDMAGQITGINEDKHQVFGWASIVQKDGEPVVDMQGDYIGVEELEKAAYDYVQNSRVGGAMHYRVDDEGNVIEKSAPYHAADLIESFVVTPEKISKMGLPDSTPVGWWVGFKVNDSEVWDMVKSGEWKGFSIHGSGRRTPKSVEDLQINDAELTR